MTMAVPVKRLNWRLISLAIVAAVVLLVVGANTHLVYVAFDSQPGCVPQAKTVDQDGTGGKVRAAGSAC